MVASVTRCELAEQSAPPGTRVFVNHAEMLDAAIRARDGRLDRGFGDVYVSDFHQAPPPPEVRGVVTAPPIPSAPMVTRFSVSGTASPCSVSTIIPMMHHAATT